MGAYLQNVKSVSFKYKRFEFHGIHILVLNIGFATPDIHDSLLYGEAITGRLR